MSQLKKNSAIVEIFSDVSLNKGANFSEVQKSDYNDALEHIKELASNPNPNNLYELMQITSYVVDSIIDVRLKYIDLIADVKRTAFDERPNFKYKTEAVKAFWQAINSNGQKSKTGYAYSGLEIEALSAFPVAEWAEVAAGRYDFADLARDVANEFERKVNQKVQSTLYATFSGLASPNYGSGSGIVSATFDPMLAKMQRFGRCAIIGDYEALQKLPSLTAIGSRTSDNIIDEVNRSGVIGTYKNAPVVVLDNPYDGLTGYNTVLDPGLIYIVPAVDAANKSLKVQFAGDVQPMTNTNIGDRSMEMRYDKHMGAGIVPVRHALAVYEDTTL